MNQALLDDVFHEFIYVVPRLNRRIQALRLSTARKLNLSRNQMDLLLLLADKGPLTLSEASKQLTIAKPNMTFLVSDLLSREFVERLHDPADKRVTRIDLSTKGREMRLEMRETFLSLVRLRLQTYKDDELRTLQESLKGLGLILDQIQEDTALDG